jgi:DNA gyrase subunit B
VGVQVEQGRSATYCYSEQELGVELKALQAAGKAQGKGYTIQRFKGLGEMMPQQLWETTMDPQTRHLKRLTVRTNYLIKFKRNIP